MERGVSLSEGDLLNALLDAANSVEAMNIIAPDSTDKAPPKDGPATKSETGLEQWSTSNGLNFVPAASTRRELPPGLYDINISSSIGLYFSRIQVKTEGLIRFPHTNSDRILSEIETFWDKRPVFEEYGLPHKRGILLWGPPGSGKSSTISLILADVTKRGGVAIRFTDAGLFIAGMRILRQIQPATPVVVLMEDLDALLRPHQESEVLNILDGVECVDRTVFLASTNYPELLGARVVNRPSRFDKRFKIGLPTDASRRMYLEHLIGRNKVSQLGIDLDRWTEDTEGFSLAHLKELFVAVVIIGDDYAEAVETLSKMKEAISSDQDTKSRMGFGNVKSLDELNPRNWVAKG